MLQNQLKNNSKVIKIILGIVILVSLTGTYFNISKQKEAEKALELVQTRNYQVISSLFSSDQARTNVQNFSNSLMDYDLNEDDCLKVAVGRAKIECKSLIANMNQLKNNQEKELIEILNLNLVNFRYSYILDELFEKNQKDDLRKTLKEEDFKKLLTVFESKKDNLRKLSDYNYNIWNKLSVFNSRSFGEHYPRSKSEINKFNELMIKGLEDDCKGFFETDNCYITKKEIESLNIKETPPEWVIKGWIDSFEENDPYIELSQRIINKAFNKKIINRK